MKTTLKTTITLVLAIALILSLTACGGGEASQPSGDLDTSPEEATYDIAFAEDAAIVVKALVTKSFGYPIDWETVDADTLLGGKTYPDIDLQKRLDESPIDRRSTVFLYDVLMDIFIYEDLGSDHDRLSSLNADRAKTEGPRRLQFEVYFDFDSLLNIEALKTIYPLSQLIIASDYWYRDLGGACPEYYECDLSQIINGETDLLLNGTWKYLSRTTLRDDGSVAGSSFSVPAGLGEVTFPFIFINQNKDGFSGETVADILNSDDEEYAERIYEFILAAFSKYIIRCTPEGLILDTIEGKELILIEGYVFEINWYE